MRLGYGGGALADYPWHLDGSKPWDYEQEKRAIHCLSSLSNLGIDFIDTAHRYGNGVSETVIGNFLNSSGYQGKILTKFEISDFNIIYFINH